MKNVKVNKLTQRPQSGFTYFEVSLLSYFFPIIQIFNVYDSQNNKSTVVSPLRQVLIVNSNKTSKAKLML